MLAPFFLDLKMQVEQTITLKEKKMITEEKIAESMPKILLRQLSCIYNLYYKIQAAHWNIEGENFYQLHKLFQEMYEDTADAIDEVAERIRALDVKIPDDILELLAIYPADPMKNGYVVYLRDYHQDAAKEWDTVASAAEKSGDSATVDLAGKRAAKHGKFAWMLRATQK